LGSSQAAPTGLSNRQEAPPFNGHPLRKPPIPKIQPKPLHPLDPFPLPSANDPPFPHDPQEHTTPLDPESVQTPPPPLIELLPPLEPLPPVQPVTSLYLLPLPSLQPLPPLQPLPSLPPTPNVKRGSLAEKREPVPGTIRTLKPPATPLPSPKPIAKVKRGAEVFTTFIDARPPAGTTPAALAAPAPTPSEKPTLPKSKQELKDNYFVAKKAPAKDTSCFFTGMDTYDELKPKKGRQASNDAKAQCKAAGLTTLEQIWKTPTVLNPGAWKDAPTGAKWTEFVTWVSEIFAEETSGHVYLLLAKKVLPRKESIFYANEFKAMKSGGKVDKIIHVEYEYQKKIAPLDPNSTDLWWKKGDEDPKTRSAKCVDEAAPECA
jgi:hypothetical protein